MDIYTLGVDTWEGSLEIDEAAFRAGGVEFAFIRINDMNGGHHKDAGFDKSWAEAGEFIRAPYFVYNPWVSGKHNFDFLVSILPAGVTTIAPDIEVRYTGYAPSTYAAEVRVFIDMMINAGMLPIGYTAQWFLPNLLTWPKDIEYWWARYITALYPPTTEHITWEQLKAKLAAVSFSPAVAAGIIPGPCALWQCSADRYVLPGTTRTLDINVFNGTPKDMIARYKFPDVQLPPRYKAAPPVVEPPAVDPHIAQLANVRSEFDEYRKRLNADMDAIIKIATDLKAYDARDGKLISDLLES